jgi:hypothetical protein
VTVLQRNYPKLKKFEIVVFRYGIWVCVVAMLSTAWVYAYLGTFSYYLADDYCEAVRVGNASSPFAAVLERYTAESWPRATMRYSNLLFVGIGESLGKNNLPVTIVSMTLLWFAGLTWSLRELGKFLKVDWGVHVDLFLGLTFGFFSLLQAPSLFQTIYWRSAMMTHFAPLVVGSFLFAFLIRQARRPDDKPLTIPLFLFIFISTFFMAGFSEPPTTTILTVLPLLMAVVWIFGDSTARWKHLPLLSVTFAGALLGLLAMLLSPASMDAAQEKTLNVIEILGNSFLYAYLFIADSLRTQPLPTFISVFIPLMLIWLYRRTKSYELSHEQKRMIWITMAAVPVLAWILIAAGFSPSVYGQSFPVERARFLARTIMIASFMLEGALIVYPLRAALNIYRFDVPEYRERAEWWDLREAYIVRHAGMGEKDIVIPGFSGVYQVKEIDNNPNHWVNRCAAQFYGVDSIRAVNMPENVLEYLNE